MATAASTVSTPVETAGAGTRPLVRRLRSVRLAWLDSTEPLLWWDRADSELWYDNSEAADIAEPIDPAEAKEPTLANEAAEATLPIERIESWEQIDRIEFSDQSDHTSSSVSSAGYRFGPVTRHCGTDAFCRPGGRATWVVRPSRVTETSMVSPTSRATASG
jgi:hypothetical protein